MEFHPKMEFHLVEDLLQQNHTLKHFGKGIIGAPFWVFVFSESVLQIGPNENYVYRAARMNSRNVRIGSRFSF